MNPEIDILQDWKYDIFASPSYTNRKRGFEELANITI